MSEAVGVVQFSTGAGSAEVAYRAVESYERVVLVTADTRVEDEDNWRFAAEVVEDLGSPEWVRLADGRTPMEVGRDRSCVPNNRMAVCSEHLKRRLIRSYVEQRWQSDEIVLLFGFDWTEEHRLEAVAAGWSPYRVAAPLMDPPLLAKPQILDRLRARGIEPPRLYAAGFGHANCGGACVRGGQAAWARLLRWNRSRYLEWEAEEEHSRQVLGKDASILRSRKQSDPSVLTLRRFRERLEQGLSFDFEDEGACGCFVATGAQP